jgi:protein-tyrosine phosphatase
VKPDSFLIRSVGAASFLIVMRPQGGRWLNEDLQAIHAKGVRRLVSMLTAYEEAELELTDEAGCCKTAKIDFLSVPVLDMDSPHESEAFDAAVAAVVQGLARGESAAVHCRQSIGRSGLFAAAVLIALGEPLDDACKTVSKARGFTVPQTSGQRRWLEAGRHRIAALGDTRHS